MSSPPGPGRLPLHILRDRFGYPGFRPGQQEAVESVLGGRDTLVVLPTGGGKSLCYQVPALATEGLTLVVSPLISLMKDQVDALEARGIAAAYVNSTLSAGEVTERFERARRGHLQLLYVAPERFDAGATARRLRDIGVSLLAVDEAHCISEWGHDFRPAYRRLREIRAALGDPVTIALTATATPRVRADIRDQLGLRDPTEIVTGFDRTNLSWSVIPVRTDASKDDELEGHLREQRDGVSIVYAATRKAVEKIAATLQRRRIKAVAYHAGLDEERRHAVQDDFMAERAKVIVATNAFGMGIDKPNVRTVIHYAMPGSLEAYYQEAGRAGRDGAPARCILLHAFQDRFTHEFFIKGSFPDRATIEKVYGVLTRRAHRDGSLELDAEDVAAVLGKDISAREVEGALRLLERAGAVLVAEESAIRVHVRFLATPERISARFGRDESASPELAVLRALWRGTRGAVAEGTVVDLLGLPPGLGDPRTLEAQLDRLQGEQLLMWEAVGGGRRLARPGAPLDGFGVDWAGVGRRRDAELSKLEEVQRYAYTKGCRRAFVLRYFGDRTVLPQPCEGCDNCLGQARERPAKGDAVPRPRPRRAPGTRQEAPDAEALSPEDATLFQALREWRNVVAKDERVPAYVIFADRTLAEVATRRPRSLVALGEVHGVGPSKLERFGEAVLAVVRGG